MFVGFVGLIAATCIDCDLCGLAFGLICISWLRLSLVLSGCLTLMLGFAVWC